MAAVAVAMVSVKAVSVCWLEPVASVFSWHCPLPLPRGSLAASTCIAKVSTYTTIIQCSAVAVWHTDVKVGYMNKVTLILVWLLLIWVSVHGSAILASNQPIRLMQPQQRQAS